MCLHKGQSRDMILPHILERTNDFQKLLRREAVRILNSNPFSPLQAYPLLSLNIDLRKAYSY
jgi:hypothetical protein